MTDVAIVAVTAFGAGYLAGRWRPLVALFEWAEGQTRDRSVRFWAAQPILAVALAAIFVTRPRRTLANIRAARADQISWQWCYTPGTRAQIISNCTSLCGTERDA